MPIVEKKLYIVQAIIYTIKLDMILDTLQLATTISVFLFFENILRRTKSITKHIFVIRILIGKQSKTRQLIYV